MSRRISSSGCSSKPAPPARWLPVHQPIDRTNAILDIVDQRLKLLGIPSVATRSGSAALAAPFAIRLRRRRLPTRIAVGGQPPRRQLTHPAAAPVTTAHSARERHQPSASTAVG
jgi:hypothetical protein